MTSAAIASTTGTARGNTQGSWRPLGSIVISFPCLSSVRCGRMSVDTGLNATLKLMGMPLLIPPWMPPLNLVSVAVDTGSGMRATEDCPPEGVRQEWFIPGTEPLDFCPIHGVPGVGGWLQRRMDDLRGIFGN